MNPKLPVPYDEMAEKAVVGTMLLEGKFLEYRDRFVDSDFFAPVPRNFFQALCRIADRGDVVRPVSMAAELNGDFSCYGEFLAAAFEPTFDADSNRIKILSARRKRLAELEEEKTRLIKGECGEFDAFSLIDPTTKLLESRAFDFYKPPDKIEPILWIGDTSVGRSGDLIAISAQVKAGKSAVVGAILACLMSPRADCDFLGFRGVNALALPLIHLDTEQSMEDYYDLILRALKRGKLPDPPSWFKSWCLTGLQNTKKLEILRLLLKIHAKEGRLCGVIIDGLADLANNVNDPAEAPALVEEMHGIAIKYQCPVVCVLHENPGTEFGKTRGHLGSQLERKAASNLRLSKDQSGIIQIWSEKLRRGHIGQGTGPHFVWDEMEMMHVSCEPGEASSQIKKQEKLTKLAKMSFTESVSLRRSELGAVIKKIEGCEQRTADSRITAMFKLGIINFDESTRLYSIEKR